RRRRRALGCAVHLQDQVVQLPVVADGAQAALERLELFRHEDLDRLVLEIAVGTSRQLDGVLGADLERLLEGLTDLHLAEPAALPSIAARPSSRGTPAAPSRWPLTIPAATRFGSHRPNTSSASGAVSSTFVGATSAISTRGPRWKSSAQRKRPKAVGWRDIR